MKQYMIFECEYCGATSRDSKEIYAHEANHLGLTKEEYESYNSMKSFVKYCSSILMDNNTEDNQKRYDTAVENLIAFEKEHNIVNGKLVKFTWDKDREDLDISKNGLTVMWVAGRSKAIQKFVEKLSYKIGFKCDFSYTAGRAHIDVSKEAYGKALEVVQDSDFMSQFLVSYSEESYNNETYFEILR